MEEVVSPIICPPGLSPHPSAHCNQRSARGQLSPKLSPRRTFRNSCNPIQPTVLTAALVLGQQICYRRYRRMIRRFDVVAAAFGLEALLFNNELSMRILICPVLLTVTLLISWCVGAMFETKTNFSALGKPRALKFQGPARQIYQGLTL